MGMIEIMKKAGVEAVGAANPVNILFGEVISLAPLEVRIDQRFILTKEFLIIPESLTRYEVDLTHDHNYESGVNGKALFKLVIREGLKQGDKLLLLRVQGGQQYVILDKVV